MNRPAIAAAIALLVATGLQAQRPAPEQIDAVLSLLPPDARAEATVLVPTDTGLAVRRQGRNEFVCVGDMPGDSLFSVSCYHRSLEDIRSLERTLSAQGYRGARFRERLCAEVADRGAPIPNGALELSASGARPDRMQLPDSIRVHHLLYFPFATEASTGIPDEPPASGRPWLHLAGTCQAHLMWEETRYPRRASGR